MDPKSLQLVEVRQNKEENVHKLCEFVVKDRSNKTATLKLDILQSTAKEVKEEERKNRY